MAKRILVSMLVFAIALTSGCSLAGDSPSVSESKTATSTSASIQQSQTKQNESEALTPFKDTVTIGVMREFNPTTWYPEGESMEDNVLTRFYKEKLNVTYKTTWKVERGQMAQQLNLAIASNDLPDVFTADANQVYRMAKAGQIKPITKAYNDFVSTKVKTVLEVGDKAAFTAVTIDKELYGMPAGEDFALGIPFFWVRQDWLNNLGIKDLKFKSNQDVIDLALRFMKEDPDKNGKADTFGVILDNTLDRYMRAFGHNLGQQVNMYLQKDGKLIYSDVQPGMKVLLKLMNDMYDQGIFDKEFAVKDFNKATERLASGEAGIFPMSFVVRGPFANNKMNQEFAEWTCIPLPPNPEGTYSVGSEKACFKWLVCNADFEYPEALVKGQNLWYELWQGDYAEYYHGLNLKEYANAGEDFKLYPPFWFDPPLKNLEQGRVFPKAWDNKDRTSIKSPETRKQYDRSIDYFINGNKKLYTGWTNMHLFYMAFPTIDKVYGGPDKIVYDAFTGPITNVIASKQSLANKTRIEWLTKFIVGNESVDAKFDTYVNEWMDAGGRDVLKEVNDWQASR